MSHSALKYLKDTEVNINQVLLMTGDFNVRDNLWDPLFPHHSSISDDLMMIADSFDLALSSPINLGPTKFSDMVEESNSVINLMFLRCGSSELDRHSIHPDSRLSSDHAPLMVDIPICEEIRQPTKLVITSGSDQEKKFFKDVFANFTLLNTSNIDNVERLNTIVNQLGSIINQAWTKHAKRSKVLKHSKQWWTNSCSSALNNYRMSRCRESWKTFKSTTREAKRLFFDSKIKEIVNKS